MGHSRTRTHDMFAVTTRPQLAARAVVKTQRAHRRASVAVRAENDVSKAVEEANSEWKDADAASKQPTMRVDAIDPADGSIAETAPLGNDNSMLDSVMLAFKDSRAVETINGRAAMIGWTAALYVELTSNTSFMHQLFNERTFTLADGITRTSTYPGRVLPRAGLRDLDLGVLFGAGAQEVVAERLGRGARGVRAVPRGGGDDERSRCDDRSRRVADRRKDHGRLRAVLIERYRTKINKQHFFKQGWAALTICAPPRQFSRR